MGDDYVDEKIEQYERKLKQAEKAGKHTEEGSLRDLELRAAILGYGPNSGDDSGRVVVQPRAIAARTRSL